MATNAGPVYGKQYIRYAETWEAPTDTQGGVVGTVEIGELRAVSYATWAGPNYAAAGDAFTVAPTSIVGINQAYMPTALAQPYTARQLTIATSGLLLIEVDPASALSPWLLSSKSPCWVRLQLLVLPLLLTVLPPLFAKMLPSAVVVWFSYPSPNN